MNTSLKMKILERFGCQADFAQALGINESTVSRVVRGRRQLPKPIQAKWAEALQCAPKDIFGRKAKNRRFKGSVDLSEA